MLYSIKNPYVLAANCCCIRSTLFNFFVF